MFRKNLLLTATVLAGLSGPALAETIPCTDVAKYGIDAEVVGKTFASIWQGSTIPERHAIKVMDVIPPIVSNSNTLGVPPALPGRQ